MIKVLFVCLGNICRSPLAEGVFQELIKVKGLSNSILCDSAGTSGFHIGALPDHRSIKTASRYGIVLKHTGRKITIDDFDDFDYILCMDVNNLRDSQAIAEKTKGKAKLLLFRDFDPEGKGNVPDPYYGSMADFEEVYKICHRTSERLLEYILSQPKKLG